MTTEKVLEALTEAAGRMGLAVRTEKGNFEGGRCRMDGEDVVMLNERYLPEQRLATLARCLRAEEMDAVYLPPAVRRALHDVWAEQDATENQHAAGNAASAGAADAPEAAAHAE